MAHTPRAAAQPLWSPVQAADQRPDAGAAHPAGADPGRLTLRAFRKARSGSASMSEAADAEAACGDAPAAQSVARDPEPDDDVKLSLTTIKTIETTGNDVIYWDDDLPGFGLRVKPRGQDLLVQYRDKRGRSKRLTIGRHGVLTPAEARAKARELLAGVELHGARPGRRTAPGARGADRRRPRRALSARACRAVQQGLDPERVHRIVRRDIIPGDRQALRRAEVTARAHCPTAPRPRRQYAATGAISCA